MDRKDKLYCRMVERDYFQGCTEDSGSGINCGLNCRDGVCYKMWAENLHVPADTTIWSSNEKYALVAQVGTVLVMQCRNHPFTPRGG